MAEEGKGFLNTIKSFFSPSDSNLPLQSETYLTEFENAFKAIAVNRGFYNNPHEVQKSSTVLETLCNEINQNDPKTKDLEAKKNALKEYVEKYPDALNVAVFARLSPDAIKTIIRSGADVNLKNAEGQTAIHTATNLGYDNIVMSLIENGANLSLKNKENQTALDIAVENQNSKLTNIIEQKYSKLITPAMREKLRGTGVVLVGNNAENIVNIKSKSDLKEMTP